MNCLEGNGGRVDAGISRSSSVITDFLEFGYEKYNTQYYSKMAY